MRSEHAALWRVIYIARNEGQAQSIEEALRQAGFLVDCREAGDTDGRGEDVEIRALDSEAEEARLYLMEQGF